jgi:hypothetical protein
MPGHSKFNKNIFIMKKFFILVAAVTAGYLLYDNFYNKKAVEIKENIIVSQASGMDINAGPSPPPKYAHIKGVVKNVGDRNLSNILIKYSVGYDTLSAIIGFLNSGDSMEFKTNNCQVRNPNPQYKLEEIKYDEEESL